MQPNVAEISDGTECHVYCAAVEELSYACFATMCSAHYGHVSCCGERADGRVPLYALSSNIALYSLNAAFFIDAVRDLYEVRLQRTS